MLDCGTIPPEVDPVRIGRFWYVRELDDSRLFAVARGIPMGGGRGMVRPYAGAEWTGDDERKVQFGAQWGRGEPARQRTPCSIWNQSDSPRSTSAEALHSCQIDEPFAERLYLATALGARGRKEDIASGGGDW